MAMNVHVTVLRYTEICMERIISFTLNGNPVHVKSDDGRELLWVLRSDLGLTGAKFGCGAGLCGACTVIVGKDAVRSCLVPMKEVVGQRVMTIEGLNRDGRLHPLQEAFLKRDALQCGYCTSGMILNAYALLLKTPHPTRADIVQEMDGNLCRCGSHLRIIDAIQDAAGSVKAGA
jgi:aerobic-type carbon monoxide dehydrogenase small subunit (CoxS/CutS family)